MSLGEAYTLGVRITGDVASLRAELAQGTALINQFATASIEAMQRAAAAMESASQKSTSAAKRQATSTKSSTDQTARAFEDYMRRATKAQQETASSAEQASQRTTSALGGISSTLGRLTGFAGMALLAKQVFQVGIGFHEFTQNSTIAFSALTGSADSAKTLLADVLAFAKQTPYAFQDLTSSAQKLLAFGFDAKAIVPTLQAVGDAASLLGRGKEGIDSLVRSLGQINAKGRLQADELLQLSEVGVNGLVILANQAGMTTVEYQKLITKGLVPADQAIAGLVKGIDEGTDGLNGQTAAFGGYMAKVKEAGGITATVDGARTSFRNAAAALTTELVPAYTDFLKLATQGLGVVKDTANFFNRLPGPVQSTALTFIAATAAVRLLNVQGRASGVWSSFAENIQAAKASAQAMGYEVGRTRAAMLAARAAAPGLGSALLGALGGPVGLAITGATLAIGAFASAQAQAKQQIREVADTLDQQTAKVTENTDAWVENYLSTTHRKFGFGSDVSALEGAKELGLDLHQVKKAALGDAKAFNEIVAALPSDGELKSKSGGVTSLVKDRAKALGLSQDEYLDAVQAVKEGVKGSSDTIEDAAKIVALKAEADDKSADAQEGVAAAYAKSSSAIRTWTEDQQKAIDAAGAAASSAFMGALKIAGTGLDLSTLDDVAKARQDVQDATDKIRDSEANLQETRHRKKASTNDIVRAEEAVQDARRKAKEAADELSDTEARRDPVAQYRKKQGQMLADAKAFADGMTQLAQGGLNATSLLELFNAGPTGSKDDISALLQDRSLIGDTNSTQAQMQQLADQVGQQASAAQAAIEAGGTQSGSDMALAFRIAAVSGTASTVQEIADKLGENPQVVYNAGTNAGMQFLQGFSDASKYATTTTTYPDGSFRNSRNGSSGQRGFASGGIFPGYTPGRDTGLIAVGGGEAIMRPEWTRAMGPGYVHRMNAIARSAGSAGVMAEMRRYLGGFANGGIAPAPPQVITVPVQVTNERHTPWTIQNAWFTDRRAAQGWGDREAAQRKLYGG